MENVVAVIVTYNRCVLLHECIEAILNLKESIDLIIVDNASTDGTEECVKTFTNKCIKYYNMGKNMGGAGGFHFGISKAYEMGYDYIWIMDDDTIVNPDSLEELLSVTKDMDNNFGWLSSLALWVDGKECKMNLHEVADEWNREKKDILKGRLLCQGATFVSLFLNRKAVQKVGLPIKEYFIWGDDTEYTKRISKEFPCYFVPKSQVIHKMKTNEGTNRVEEIVDKERIERMFYSVRNDFCTFRRMGKKKAIQYLLHQISVLVRVICSKSPYKWKKAVVVLRGLWAGIWFCPKIDMVE